MSIQEIKHYKNISTSPGRKYFPSWIMEFFTNSRLFPYIKNVNFWTWSIIILGLIIRLVQYLHNRSLWTDEAALALNITGRPFSQLLKPLANNQGAPFGFLAVSKLSTFFGGETELALRLFPLLTGLAALILFYYLSKIYLKPRTTLIAVALFAFSEPLYYYSAEFKPYSSDVFFAVLLFIIITKLKDKELSTLNIFILSISGAIIIWFSFPSVFILSGAGIYFLFNFLIKAELKSFFKFTLVCIFWLISFTALYFVFLISLSHSSFMEEFWNESFMPIPSLSFGFFSWLINTFFNTFGYSLTISLSGLAGLLFLIGLITFYKNKRVVFYIFTLPILFTLLVSMFHKYPFQGRLILFLVPPLFVSIAAGLETIKVSTINHKSIFVIASILLIFPIFYNSVWVLYKPIEKEEIKQTLTYLKEHIHPKDDIYLYYGSIYAFDFYKNKFDLFHNPVIIGIKSRDNWQVYANDLNQLKRKDRVWVLFSHIYQKTDEKLFFLTYLNSIGTLKSSFKTTGAEIYLFSFQ